MKKKLKYLDDEITYFKLDDGLLVYLIPSKKYNKYDVSLCVKYGSSNQEYMIGKNKIHDISGLAHYLEHQLFTMPTSDSFNYFSKTGTIANAQTSFFSTKYYISGSKSFVRNLNYFLKMIFTPYFTDASVLKEQGIIKEEIMMYDDDIDWILDNKLRSNIFNKHHVRDKIAGEVEDIMKITKEDLYRAYNYFYIPSNMILTITGNFDALKTMELLKKMDFLKRDNHKIVRVFEKEDELTKSEYSELYDNTNVPRVCYGFKINKDNIPFRDDYMKNLYLNCLFYILFDETSLFSEEVYKNKYCLNYYIDHLYVDNFYLLTFYGDTNYADLFKDTIDKYLAKIKVNEDELARIKKILIASEIKVSDNLQTIGNSIQDDFVIYNKIILDRIEYIKKINLFDMNKVINNLSFDNNSFVLMFPKGSR